MDDGLDRAGIEGRQPGFGRFKTGLADVGAVLASGSQRLVELGTRTLRIAQPLKGQSPPGVGRDAVEFQEQGSVVVRQCALELAPVAKGVSARQIAVRASRTDANLLVLIGERAVEVAPQPPYLSAIRVGPDVPGVSPDRLIVIRDRLVVIALISPDERPVVVENGEIRLQANGFAIIREGSVQISDQPPGRSADAVDPGIVGVETSGLFKIGKCPPRFALPVPRLRTIDPGPHIGRVEANGLIVIVNRAVELLLVREGHASQRMDSGPLIGGFHP